jgi:snRNA-activating protein complex subunit 2
VLTIAATEPLSLLHSKPPKPTKAHGKPLPLSTTRGQENPTSAASSPAPETSGSTPEASGSAPEAQAESLAGPSIQEDFTVDFEKIYKYLSFSSRSGRGPELSAAGEWGKGREGLAGGGGVPGSGLALPSLLPFSSITRVSCGP